LLVVVGVLFGIPVGASLGFYVVRFGGPLVFGREFVQIGWLFAMLTVPGGALLGAVLGGLTIAKRPRLFLITFLPLAIFFVGLQITLSTLREMDRPRSFVLEIKGTPGAEYFGLVAVDGEIQKRKGSLPAKFEFEAFRIELAFALVSPKEEDIIAVKVSADGRDLDTGQDSPTGVHQNLRSFGYSEKFGGTSTYWHLMSPEEVDRLIKDHTMPSGRWVP